MEVRDISTFLPYFEKVRERTMGLARVTPPDKLEWSCRSGAFTIGDLFRHIAATERWVFVEGVLGRPSRYAGCGKELADGYDNILAYMERLHAESVEMLSQLTPVDLNGKGLSPGGVPISAWKLLRAMVEHETHHRGQIYVYLGMLGVTAPPLYGLTSEQLREKSAL